jgi:hypothetical protein
MIDLASFTNLRLRGGFVIVKVELAQAPLRDALGRDAIAQTRVTGHEFHLTLRSGLSEEELSVTLYHEILEAAAIAIASPPRRVLDFNEGDFEQAARTAHARWGLASSENLDRMLQFYDFRAE